MKTKIFAAVLWGFITLISCSKSDDSNPVNEAPIPVLSVESDGTSVLLKSNITPVLGATALLSDDEIEFLYTMREEEKLCRDLYLLFSAKYPAATPIGKIASAESTHIAAIETLLDYYELEYPAMNANGVFEDAARQALYNELANKSATLSETYQTMAFVEERMIFNYRSAQGQITNANLLLIISNMIKASSNHLKAVAVQITTLGGSYTPVYLSPEEFSTLCGSSFQRGDPCGQQKGQGGNTNSQKGGGQCQGNTGNGKRGG